MGRRQKPFRDSKPYKNRPRSGKATKKSVQQSVKSSGQKLAQEKHNSNLRKHTTTQLQHMRAKLRNLMERSSSLFSTRGFHIFVILIIGILLIFVGGIFTFANRIRKDSNWSNTGPAILIASDKPLCGVEILATTEDDGTTTLFFLEEEVDNILSASHVQHSGVDEGETQSESDENKEENQNEQVKMETVPQEEYHLWIYLNSLEDVPINWTILKQSGDVRNYELSQSTPGDTYEFLASETHKSSGSDKVTAFKITYGATHFNLVEIRISEDPKHTVFRGNGIYRPRLPFVFPWHGFKQSSDFEEIYNDFTERSSRIIDADLMRLSINNCQMYFPILKIESSYASLSLLQQHDLEPMWISPKIEDGYPLIRWTQYICSFPIIQFRDKTWEKNAKRNNLLGGIFVGLGLNVLFTFTNLYPVKKKR